MSELKIDKARPINPTGTIQLCESGDTITIPAGATFANSGTTTGLVPGDVVKISNVKYEGRDSHGSTHTWYALTGLNLSHQAASTNNKLLFLAQNVGTLNPGGSSFSYRFYDRTNSDDMKGSANAQTDGSRPLGNAKSYCDSTSWATCSSMMAWVTPANTGIIQYGIDVMHQHADFRTNGNYDNSDSGTVDRSRGLSTFTIIEFDSGVIK
tara:strand:- start:1099 stop:1728 length:630 start_codon:yes stop_codon:yes gene_type:complete